MVLTSVFSPMLTSVDDIVTAEKISILALVGTDSVNVPSMLVVVPVEVPLIITDAFGTGEPSDPVTFPVMVRVWASALSIRQTMAISSNSFFLMCISFG
jgi:hypothetical protein